MPYCHFPILGKWRGSAMMRPAYREKAMPDVFSKKKRSQVMSAIHSKGNQDTEVRLLSMLRRHRITGWRRHAALPGKPDFTFRRERVILFVDGCFWHGCPLHGRQPGTHKEYWSQKISRNKERDRRVARELRGAGWRVLRIWEHLLKNEREVMRRIRDALQREGSHEPYSR